MRRQRGFTLIEIMISVGIVGILAAIALPNFVDYQLKSKTVEARNMLGCIRTSQESFVIEFDNNADVVTPDPPTTPGIERQSWVNVPCDPMCNHGNPALCATFACLGLSPPASVYYQYASPARFASGTITPEYAIGAAGDLDGDGVLGSYGYRSGHGPNVTQGVVADGISSCTAGIPIDTVLNCAPAEF